MVSLYEHHHSAAMLIHIEITKNELKFVTRSLKELFLQEITMSAWLDSTLANIITIATGNGAAIQAQVTALAKQLGTDEGNSAATTAEFQTAINALIKQLAAAPVPTGPVPVVSSLSAANGSINGGEVITISGTGFTGATVVHFGAVAATGLTVVNDTTITAVSPAQASGKVDVTVTTPGGVSAVVAADSYTLA